MMSLFSSFDLTFWSSTLLILSLTFLSPLLKIWLNTSMFSSFKFIELELLNFYFSLNPKKMFKMSLIFFYSLIASIFFCNFTCIFPFIFSFSSQVSIVAFFSMSLWLSFMMTFLSFNFKGFLYHSIPEGTPFGLIPLLFVIELISNLIRPLTLMVRLVANILAGHLLMILLSNLIMNFSIFFFMLILLDLVEMFVSLIQSYIFTTMVVLYYSEIN